MSARRWRGGARCSPASGNKTESRHYAPIPDTLAGEPEMIFPFLGSSRLMETTDRFDDVRAVFHGHAHHGIYQGRTRKGVPVFNAAAPVPKPTGKPYALVEV